MSSSKKASHSSSKDRNRSSGRSSSSSSRRRSAPPPPPKKSKSPWIVGSVIVVALIALVSGLIAINVHQTDSQAKGNPPAVAQRLDPNVCNPVKFDPNEGMDFVSEGVESRADDLAKMAVDPRNIAVSAIQIGLFQNPKDWPSLYVPATMCLSRGGVDLYNAVYGYYMGDHPNVERTVVDENAKIPAGFYNSGVDADGNLVINDQPDTAVGEDAIHYTIKLQGVEKPLEVYKKKECDNPQFAYQPPQFKVVKIPPPPQRIVVPPPPNRTTVIITPPPPPPPPPVAHCPPGAPLPYPVCFPPPVEQCPPGAPLPFPVCFPPPVEDCPPGQVRNENGVCVVPKPPELTPQGDDAPQGQGGQPNANPGPGDVTIPTLPPSTPRVDPPPPTDTGTGANDGATQTTVVAPPPQPDLVPPPGTPGADDEGAATEMPPMPDW